jgi:hypothetical protein
MDGDVEYPIGSWPFLSKHALVIISFDSESKGQSGCSTECHCPIIGKISFGLIDGKKSSSRLLKNPKK